MKDHFNHDYIVFIKGTASTIPPELLGDKVPELILSRFNDKIQDFFVASKRLFDPYNIDVDYPFKDS